LYEGITVADVQLGYFLEDVGQEAFIVSLAERIADEVGLAVDALQHDLRSTVGGKGTAVRELRRFLLDVRRGHHRPFDVLIVAIDGNCQGYVEKRNEIQQIVEQTHYRGSVVCAVPDPHVEYWYLIDAQALRSVIEADVQFEVPAYKCERGRYKRALQNAFRQAGIFAPLGGAEYGADVAAALDLYAVGRVDAGFRHFVDDLRVALTPLARSQHN
jgi:hypothetical protein